MAVMPYVGMDVPRPTTHNIPQAPVTNADVRKEVIDLGELDPLILDMDTSEKLKAADVKITMETAVMEEPKSQLPMYLALGGLVFLGFKKWGS
jgi:hypothetical protein